MNGGMAVVNGDLLTANVDENLGANVVILTLTATSSVDPTVSWGMSWTGGTIPFRVNDPNGDGSKFLSDNFLLLFGTIF